MSLQKKYKIVNTEPKLHTDFLCTMPSCYFAANPTAAAKKIYTAICRSFGGKTKCKKMKFTIKEVISGNSSKTYDFIGEIIKTGETGTRTIGSGWGSKTIEYEITRPSVKKIHSSNTYTVAELRKMAAVGNIKNRSKMNKAELCKVLNLKC